MEMLTTYIDFETLRRLVCVLCLLALAAPWAYPRGKHLRAVKGRRLFWMGFLLFAFAFSGTVALHLLRMPRGLAARYYENLSWAPDPNFELDRYFYADGSGRRVERFIDLNANDFNLHTFRGKPFSVEWQGYVYIPEDGYRVNLRTNFDSRFRLDGEVIANTFEGADVVDFGKAEAREYLAKGWSFDARTAGENPVDYVWAENDDTLLLLAADRPVDYQLYIRCYPFSYPGSPPQEMEVWIEDALLGRIQLKDGWKDYTIDVPRSVMENRAPGTIPFKFAFSRVTKVSDVTESSDDRELSVAFDVVKLQAKGGEGQSLPELSSPALSKGLHRLDFKAKIFRNRRSYIQLVWSSGEDGREEVIPEDVLFAELDEQAQFLTRFRLERALLWGLSLTIFLDILLLAGWLFQYAIRPNYRRLLTREVLALVLVCLFAFAVRAAFTWERSLSDPGFHLITPGTDQANYVAYARGIFRGYWPGLSHQPFHFNLLNSFYIALTFLLFGENLFATRIITAALGVGTILFAYAIARHLFNKQIAFVTAFLCACNGVLIFYQTSLIIAPLKMFLSIGTVWLLIKLQDDFSWKTTIGAGIFLGLNALSRATILLFMPFALLWLLWRVPVTFFRRVACCAVLCLVMFATISPATIRNYFSNDRHPFVLITSGDFGFNWWAANNPSATGIFGYSGQLLHEVKQQIESGRTTFEREVFKYIKTQPLDYIYLEYKKLKFFWRGYEPANLLPYYLFRQHSKVLGLPWINFVLIGPLALVGLGLAWKTWRRTGLLYAFLGMQMGLLLIFWVLARYRIVVVPLLSIFAAYTLCFLAQALRRKQWLRFGLTLGLCLMLYLAFNYPDAARYYRQHHGEVMPFMRIFRYWDVYHTW